MNINIFVFNLGIGLIFIIAVIKTLRQYNEVRKHLKSNLEPSTIEIEPIIENTEEIEVSNPVQEVPVEEKKVG